MLLIAQKGWAVIRRHFIFDLIHPPVLGMLDLNFASTIYLILPVLALMALLQC
jgi:hypothetical protein